jgi:hypothetical protein
MSDIEWAVPQKMHLFNIYVTKLNETSYVSMVNRDRILH